MYRWFLARGLPLKDRDGKIVRWFCASTDIHEQKETQAALTAAKERLSAALVDAHQAQQGLCRARDELESRVRERTSELAHTNAALRESEAQLRRLAEAVPQFVWIARPDGAGEYVNARWIEYTGLPLQAPSTTFWRSALHP